MIVLFPGHQVLELGQDSTSDREKRFSKSDFDMDVEYFKKVTRKLSMAEFRLNLGY